MSRRKYERAEWFEKFIAAKFVKESTEHGREAGLIRGSSAGTQCKRRLAYPLLGFEPLPNDASNQWVLNIGNGLHDTIQLLMAKWGIVNAEPVLKNGELHWIGDCEGDVLDHVNGIVGHHDGLTREINGKRYLLEFKTCTDRPKTLAVMVENLGGVAHTVKYVVAEGQSCFDTGLRRLDGSPPKPLLDVGNAVMFDAAKEAGIVDIEGAPLVEKALVDVVVQGGKFTKLTSPDPAHVVQASFYAQSLGADECLVIYLAKEHDRSAYEGESIFSVPIKAYSFAPDLEAVKKFQARAAEVWQGVDDEVLPPPQFQPGKPGSECGWCNFVHLCHADDEGVQYRHRSVVQELKMIGREGPSLNPWVTHSQDSQARRRMNSKEGIK